MDAIGRIELKGKITAAIEGADLGPEDAVGLLANLSEGYRERLRADSEEDEDMDDDDDFDEEEDDLDFEDEDEDEDDEDDEPSDELMHVVPGVGIPHAAEPWFLRELRRDNGALQYLEVRYQGKDHLVAYEDPTKADIATLRRVVACVNAFAGVSVDVIENIESGSLSVIGRGVISWEDKSGDRCSLQEARDVEFKKPGWEAERVGYLAGREDAYADAQAHQETEAEVTAYAPDARHKDAWEWLANHGMHLVYRHGPNDRRIWSLRAPNGAAWQPTHTSDTPFGCVRQAMAEQQDFEKELTEAFEGIAKTLTEGFQGNRDAERLEFAKQEFYKALEETKNVVAVSGRLRPYSIPASNGTSMLLTTMT